ncbi:MAG TPA: biopolymer transporter ExbD [Rhodothermales bacterium]|nr:biopolymer transporter ExbD [Rhodothermales bacterium]
MAGLLKKRRRLAAEIPTVSMADIAFLLLIFFLTATTIDAERGIRIQLPPKVGIRTPPPPPVAARDLLKILVDERGQVFVNDRPSSYRSIRNVVQQHVLNNGRLPEYSESPNQAIVSIKTRRETRYDDYVRALDEVWMAYHKMWTTEARKRGYASYDDYAAENGTPNAIVNAIKPNISIAEPDSAGTGFPPAG